MNVQIAAALSSVGLSLIALGGCAANRVSSENDRLRAENAQLRDERDTLVLRVSELESAMRAVSTPPGATAPQSLFVPHVAALTLDRRAYAEDHDGDGRGDLLVLALKPVDGRGRFLQLAGPLSLQLVVVTAGAAPREFGALTMTGEAVQSAYRESMMGTHYTLAVPVVLESSTDGEPWPESALVHVEYEDVRTGAHLTLDETIPLRHIMTNMVMRRSRASVAP